MAERTTDNRLLAETIRAEMLEDLDEELELEMEEVRSEGAREPRVPPKSLSLEKASIFHHPR